MFTHLMLEGMTIKHLLTINGALLMGYHIDSKCYKYSIAFWDGGIYQTDDIFYTADRALEAGLEEIRITIGYQ